MAESYYVYILQDAAGGYYVGYTGDIAARVLAHQTFLLSPVRKSLQTARDHREKYDAAHQSERRWLGST
jgi:predicted GIY-YIG superfamily endonuclease